MKAVKARILRGLRSGSNLVCADNTGAKIVQVIAVFGYKGIRRRQPTCGVADVIKVTVKQGDVKTRKQVFNAVVIRQKAAYRRKEGLRVAFEDNAAILVDDNYDPKGTEIKGPVAREVIERFSSIGKISSVVV